MRKILTQIPFSLVGLACLTLGLAPFAPQPHVVEKLIMLSQGALARPIDMFDLLFHGAPWVLLLAKLVVVGRKPRD